MIKIGLTGGIGSGKSVVSKIFAGLGIPIYNADLEARNIVNTNIEVIEAIKKQFGTNIYDSNNLLNRPQLASIVFADAEKLNTLNSIVHPAVNTHFLNWTETFINSKYIIKEAAILFESGAYKSCDKTIMVYAPENIRIQRVVQRDTITEKQIKERMSNQYPEQKLLSLCDYVINNYNNQPLIPQVINLHNLFLSLT